MSTSEKQAPPTAAWRKIVVCLVIGGLLSAYILGIVLGKIEKDNRIDAVHLGLIVFAVLALTVFVHPELLTQLKSFEVSGFKLERLEKVQMKQAQQEDRLKDIVVMLPLLLPEVERQHLLNLAQGQTRYRGSSTVRAELRHLRSAGLVTTRPGCTISQIQSEQDFDLADYLELTPSGRDWVKRIREIETRDEAV